MKVFISYHRADTYYREKIVNMLDSNGHDWYAVPENANFDGQNHQHIKDQIICNMKDCQTVVCIVGNETYTRPHVDWELHEGLKGDVGKRKGIVAVLLEERDDSKNKINYETFPNRLQENEKYIVLEQFASFASRVDFAIEKANNNRINKKLQVDNTRTPMELRKGNYYDNN